MTEIGVRIQGKGQVTIPRNIRKKLNLKSGDRVIFVETEAGVMVKPAPVAPVDELSAPRADMTDVVRSIREHFKDYPADEIEALANEAIREARGKGA